MAELDDVRTVIDFKTAVAAYQDHDVQLSDQLTAYQLAEPDAQQVATRTRGRNSRVMR